MKMTRQQRLCLYLAFAAMLNVGRIFALFDLPDTSQALSDLLPRMAVAFIAILLLGEFVFWIGKTVRE